MAWIFALWVQCRTGEETSAFAAHFKNQCWTLSDGVQSACEVSIMAKHCWIVPTNVSRSGVGNAEDAAQLTEVGKRLYEHLRSAPTFVLALVGVEVDADRTEVEIDEILRDPHPAYRGIVVSTDIGEHAGRPSKFEPFKHGYVWWPYLGEQLDQRVPRQGGVWIDQERGLCTVRENANGSVWFRSPVSYQAEDDWLKLPAHFLPDVVWDKEPA